MCNRKAWVDVTLNLNIYAWCNCNANDEYQSMGGRSVEFEHSFPAKIRVRVDVTLNLNIYAQSARNDFEAGQMYNTYYRIHMFSVQTSSQVGVV